MVDIFDESNKIEKSYEGSNMKFKVIGDCVSGTLIDVRDSVSQLSGNPQKLYVIKSDGREIVTEGNKVTPEKGDIWMVYSTKFMENQMEDVKVGQIIGLKYEGDKAPKVKGYHPTKCIVIFANDELVDKEWLDSQGGSDSYESKKEKQVEEFEKDMEQPDSVELQIVKLAQEKLSADPDDIEDVKVKVMEATKKAFIDQNLESILTDLKNM